MRWSFLPLLPLLLFLSWQEPDLDAVLAKLEATRQASAAERAPWLERLLGHDGERARRAALDAYVRETNLGLKARLLAHAAPLPGLDATMLAELESGVTLDLRAIAARYFVERHAGEGIDLCLQLVQRQPRDALLVPAVLIALAHGGAGRAAELFRQRYLLAPPTARHRVLALCRDVQGEAMDAVRRQALLETWPPLRAEAMSQLAARRDPAALAMARKLADPKDASLAAACFEALAAAPQAADWPRLGQLLAYRTEKMRRLLDELARRLAADAAALAWAGDAGRQDGRAGVRLLALQVLDATPGSTANDMLLELAGDADAQVRRTAWQSLARRGDQRLRQRLTEQVDREPLEARLDALEALDVLEGEATGKEHGARLIRLAGDGPLELRILAIELGGRRGVRELLPAVAPLLAHPDWRLRAAGVDLARRVRDASHVPLLIAALQGEKGRLAQDIKDALASLTRLFFEDPAGWKTWWEKEGATFVLPPAETKPTGKPTVSSTAASFYGLPVTSQRVVYCLDTSGSMGEAAGSSLTRLKVAKTALAQALRNAPAGSQVNVLFFSSNVQPYAKSLVTLGARKELDKLLEFIEQRTPLGETDIYGVLRTALDDRQVDTIYLLTDGLPSAGELQDPGDLADEIKRRNRTRRAVIHCIAVGGPNALLERLALESSGTYAVR